ncbi:hypothetical protein HanXRQr2_Chr15g0712491 [Helianthus annuus]|uniref:Uncharacterized protein n=1 Tax=Helianthus annuus TaxID=4232 RepID=A0A9K3H4K9_HELAN|nr:hypothetical protein HanXRQr2_Chr15g0712491 [Helianthus annuus]
MVRSLGATKTVRTKTVIMERISDLFSKLDFDFGSGRSGPM